MKSSSTRSWNPDTNPKFSNETGISGDDLQPVQQGNWLSFIGQIESVVQGV